MFTLYDLETGSRTWIPEKQVDYLACDSEECVMRYKNTCSPEAFKEYTKLVGTRNCKYLQANGMPFRYRYSMPHLDKEADEAAKNVKNHSKLHGCDGRLLVKVFPKGDPNYDTLSNSLNHK